MSPLQRLWLWLRVRRAACPDPDFFTAGLEDLDEDLPGLAPCPRCGDELEPELVRSLLDERLQVQVQCPSCVFTVRAGIHHVVYKETP